MDNLVKHSRPISWWVLLMVGLASVVMMGVLAFLPTTVHERVDGDHPGYTTMCSSVVVAGWPRDIGSIHDQIAARGILTTNTSEPPYDICANRRSLFTAGMAVLAAPASTLLILAAGPTRQAPRLKKLRER